MLLHVFLFKTPNIYIIIHDLIGTSYRLSDNWFNNIDINSYKNKQINYLGEKESQIFIKKI